MIYAAVWSFETLPSAISFFIVSRVSIDHKMNTFVTIIIIITFLPFYPPNSYKIRWAKDKAMGGPKTGPWGGPWPRSRFYLHPNWSGDLVTISLYKMCVFNQWEPLF
jgi:hypothetical protein